MTITPTSERASGDRLARTTGTHDITRRTALIGAAVSGTALLAGCGGILGSATPDVVVFNRTDNDLTVEVTLDDESGELLSETTTIAASDAFEREDVLPSSGQVTLSIAVENGPSDSRAFDVSEDSSLQARIDEDAIQFDEM